MSNNSILTSQSYSHEVEKFYNSPILSNKVTGEILTNLYCFIAKGDMWDNPLEIPKPENSSSYIKTIYKNMIAIKKIYVNDLSAVIQRIDWESGRYYDTYSESESISEVGSNGKLIKNFYARNSYDQVFKCLWNNNNVYDSVYIDSIQKNNNICSIEHDGRFTFEIGSYVTINNANPPEYNGTYIVVGGSTGIANVEYAFDKSYTLKANLNYIDSGLIKSSVLSTNEPYLDIGSFDNSLVVTMPDGYKWKYIYTLDKGRKEKFFDDNWMPIPVDIESPRNSYSSEFKAGCIDVVNVVYGGNNFTQGFQTAQVIITGDGSNATATAYINSSNAVGDIIVTNPGENYTYADISIVPLIGYSGNGAILKYDISPIGGHGFDLVSEFCCNRIMVTAEFNGSEDGEIPENIMFRQIGLISNPYEYSNSTRADNKIYNLSTKVVVSPSYIPFMNGEYVYQGDSIEDNYFKAICLSYDTINSILYLINISGTLSVENTIFGESSGAFGVVLNSSMPSIAPYTGNILYIENLPGTQRTSSDTEQFKLIIKY